MNVPVEVVEAAAAGRCVLFVGNRATLEAVTESGGEFLGQRRLARKLGGRVSVREAVGKLLEGAPREEVLRRVAGFQGATEAEPGEFHRRAVRRFTRIYTTCRDALLEQAAQAEGIDYRVVYPGEPLPDFEAPGLVITKLWGGFERPESVVLSDADQALHPLSAQSKALRAVFRKKVVFFVGYRPDEEDFDLLFDDLSEAYGGELPRVHLAVSQGRISDYHWQKWVWRGLLLFIADPSEALEAVDAQVEAL
ncbi:MAG: SIR2 family protein [Myxococcota bacterium]|nr:SIR2 family protein [Myxococcota bacterium]